MYLFIDYCVGNYKSLNTKNVLSRDRPSRLSTYCCTDKCHTILNKIFWKYNNVYKIIIIFLKVSLNIFLNYKKVSEIVIFHLNIKYLSKYEQIFIN